MKACDACNRVSTPLDKAHIKSRGSGGCDEEWNLLALCRPCHSMQHAMGWKSFTKHYPYILEILKERGFYFDPHNKLKRDIDT